MVVVWVIVWHGGPPPTMLGARRALAKRRAPWHRADMTLARLDDDPFDYPELLDGLQTVSAVCAALLAKVAPFGYRVLAIGAIPHPSLPYPEEFFVQTWPEAWHQTYFTRGFGEHDPTLRALGILPGAFTTGDLRHGAIGPLSPRETEVLDFAASLGLPNGFLTPVHRANGYRGLACVVGAGPEPDSRLRSLLQHYLLHTHDRLRSLMAGRAAVLPALSEREVHVMALSRRGLTDSQIAQEAGITARTVRFHFENARHKLGARNRAEALSLAIARHLLPQ